MPIQSIDYRPFKARKVKKLTWQCHDKIIPEEAKRQKAKPHKSYNLPFFLHKFYLFLITVPPMARGIYTCYYKLDGFNYSLRSFHVHTMPAWLLWVIVAMSEWVFFIYGIKHGALDNTPKTPSALGAYLKKLLKSISPIKLYKNIRYNRTIGDRTRAFACLTILVNLVFYVWVAGDAAYVKFYQVFHYSFKPAAIVIGIFCAVGALMSTMTFTLMVVIKAFPHLLKIRTIYQHLMQKILGVFLILLALLSAPLTIIMAKDSSTPLFFVIFFAVIATFLVYVMSVYGLCREQIDALNRKIAIKKLAQMIAQLTNPFERRLLNSLFLTIKEINADLKHNDFIKRRELLQEKVTHLNRQLQAVQLSEKAKALWRESMSIYRKENPDIKKHTRAKKKFWLKEYVLNRKLPACILFLTSSSVAGIGTGFSCQAFLTGHAQVSRLIMWATFLLSFSITIIGKMCFSSMSKTVQTITRTYERAISKVKILTLFKKNSL
jgi:hypothetical protein